jgi:hypothetical protein
MLYIILKKFEYGESQIFKIIQTNKSTSELQNIFGNEYIITQFTNQEYINKYTENNIIKIYNQNYEIFNI